MTARRDCHNCKYGTGSPRKSSESPCGECMDKYKKGYPIYYWEPREPEDSDGLDGILGVW